MPACICFTARHSPLSLYVWTMSAHCGFVISDSAIWKTDFLLEFVFQNDLCTRRKFVRPGVILKKNITNTKILWHIQWCGCGVFEEIRKLYSNFYMVNVKVFRKWHEVLKGKNKPQYYFSTSFLLKDQNGNSLKTFRCFWLEWFLVRDIFRGNSSPLRRTVISEVSETETSL